MRLKEFNNRMQLVKSSLERRTDFSCNEIERFIGTYAKDKYNEIFRLSDSYAWLSSFTEDTLDIHPIDTEDIEYGMRLFLVEWFRIVCIENKLYKEFYNECY